MAKNITANTDTILYHVRSGDTLAKLIKRYHGSVNTIQRDSIIKQIQNDNPAIKNPNRIYPNQLLQLAVPSKMCTATSHPGTTPTLKVDKKLILPLQQKWQQSTVQEKKLLTTLTPIMLGTGSATMTMINKTFSLNTPLLSDMAKNYDNYKAGTISKGQYDYRRKKLVTNIKSRLGPLQKILNSTRKQSEILRISRTKGRAPTQNITRQIGRMNRLAKYASRGGVVLTAVSLGMACNDIANTTNTLKKNQILVESVGGVLGGVAAGVAIMLMFTPVGWVAALAVGVAGAVGGYAAGKGSVYMYNLLGQKVDIASASGVSNLCQK